MGVIMRMLMGGSDHANATTDDEWWKGFRQNKSWKMWWECQWAMRLSHGENIMRMESDRESDDKSAVTAKVGTLKIVKIHQLVWTWQKIPCRFGCIEQLWALSWVASIVSKGRGNNRRWRRLTWTICLFRIKSTGRSNICQVYITNDFNLNRAKRQVAVCFTCAT